MDVQGTADASEEPLSDMKYTKNTLNVLVLHVWTPRSAWDASPCASVCLNVHVSRLPVSCQDYSLAIYRQCS